jgi:hypothetical protein
MGSTTNENKSLTTLAYELCLFVKEQKIQQVLYRIHQ